MKAAPIPSGTTSRNAIGFTPEPGKKFPMGLIIGIVAGIGILTFAASTGKTKSQSVTVAPAPVVAPAPPAQSGASITDQVTVTVTNRDCNSSDFYVSDRLAVSVPAESSQSFSIASGSYQTKACLANSSNCGNSVPVNWSPGKAQHAINRNGSCSNQQLASVDQVLVTVINRDCHPTDFYASERLVASIPAESSQSFGIASGSYQTKACLANSSNCGNSVSVNWSPGKAQHAINRNDSCNNHN
jgi:hypothetical protein